MSIEACAGGHLTRRCSWPARARAVVEPFGRQLSGKVVRPALALLLGALLAGTGTLTIIGCAAPSSAAEVSKGSDEELAVYATLLNTAFVHEGTRELVVSSERAINGFAGPACVPQSSLRAALQSAQSEAGPFPSSVPTTVPLVVVSPEVLRETTGTDWGSEWEPFFEAYPRSDGIITLSAVGLDPLSGMALVTFTFKCGSLCGGAGYYILKKDSGQWAIVDGGQIIEY